MLNAISIVIMIILSIDALVQKENTNKCETLQMIQNENNQLQDLGWKSEKTMRADLLTNRQISHTVLRLFLLFVVVVYGCRLLPSAHKTISLTPSKWSRINTLEVHDVGALNRYMKVYAMPANSSQDMDRVHQIDVMSLKDDEARDNKLEVRVGNMQDFMEVGDEGLRFFFGEVRVLDEIAYSVQIQKPVKVGQQSGNGNGDQTVKQQTNSNTSQKIEKQKDKEQSERNIRQTQETKNKELTGNQVNQPKIEDSKQSKDQEKIQQNQENQKDKEKEKENEKDKEKEKEKGKGKGKEQGKEEKQKQKQNKQKEDKENEKQELGEQSEFSNIRIEVQLMSSFGTVFELIIRYISMLMILYMGADNYQVPISLPIICALTSNPLLFLQISYPNRISDIIECICESAPLLYIPTWVFYIHTNITFPDETKHKVYLGIKTALGVVLYILNIFQLLNFHVLFLQVIIALPLTFFLGSYLWEAFLDLYHQHHRDKVLITTTICYIVGLLAIRWIAGEWKFLILYMLHQVYGLTIIYLMGSPEKWIKPSSNSNRDENTGEWVDHKLKQNHRRSQIKSQLGLTN